MVRTNQGGSVLSFVIVGVVLAGLAIGAVYFVHRQTMQPVDPSEPHPVATQPETPQPEASQPEETTTKPEEKAQEKPAETTRPAQQPQPSQSIPGASTPATGALPKTGPAETLGVIIALSLLSIATVSYIRSRRLELPL
jgi:outer membrane biosynthesis protein TonB